jgi:hypothetical protein
MKFNKFALIGKALKILKPLNKLYNSVKNILPKKKVDETAELRREIESLKRDLKRHEEKIKELSLDAIKEKEAITKKEEWIQAEMYVSVVNQGERKGGSESGGYILVNLPAKEFAEIEKEFHNMPTNTLKEKLGIQDDKVVKNVAHGQTISTERTRFIEINGDRQPFTKGALQ